MAAVTVADDEAAMAEAVAARITALVVAASTARGGAAICLTGGGTSVRPYRALADADRPWRSRIDWMQVHLFWGDERHVPPHHPDSNYGMAARALVSRVPIPSSQVHRIRGERPSAADAAKEYEAVLPNTFDVLLLGLGEDAHIASIFPNSPLLGSDPATGRLNMLSRPVAGSDPKAAAVWVPYLNAWRITLTPSAILNARAILLLVAGAGKAPAVRAALEAPDDVPRFPAHVLRSADDRVEWFLDRAAAGR